MTCLKNELILIIIIIVIIILSMILASVFFSNRLNQHIIYL